MIDLVRADGELVEVQTGGFGPLGPKLDGLLDDHRVRIVHPVAAERRIVRVGEGGEVLSARRSPRRATVVEIFDKLRHVPVAAGASEPDARGAADARGPHARAGADQTPPAHARPGQRRLVEVIERVELRDAGRRAERAAGPAGRAVHHARAGEARCACPTMLAQRTVYCLELMELLEPAGKRGRAPLHRVV